MSNRRRAIKNNFEPKWNNDFTSIPNLINCIVGTPAAQEKILFYYTVQRSLRDALCVSGFQFLLYGIEKKLFYFYCLYNRIITTC